MPGASGTWIAGGQPDTSDSSVVVVIDLLSDTVTELCSGVLLAPNAVLTARHCVAALTGNQGENVACDAVQFGALRSVDDFRVTTAATLPAAASTFHRVREIAVPQSGGNMLCGHDVAILILADPVSSSTATPLVPVTVPPVVGQPYSAVGYGTSSDAGQDAGARRRRVGLAIACVDGDCGTSNVVVGEFAGGAGVCAGDSGGPALDENQHVLGVASRGAADCASSVYETAAAQLDFLKTTVRHAAELAGQQPPGWAAASTNSSTSDDGGCNLSGAASDPPSPSSDLLLLVPAALWMVRRRRGSSQIA